MRCIKCGYENIEGLKYCSSCGHELLTQEQYAKKERQKKNKKALKVVLIVLAIAFVACIVSYIIINNQNNKTKEDDEQNKTIDKVLVGTWNCKAYREAPNYTIEIVFREDRSYNWGTYGKSNLDYTKGTFYSKDMGVFPENENYEAYSVTLDAKSRATNGAEVEDIYSINYNLALHNDTNSFILASGDSNSYNTYCDRKM